MEPDLLFDSQQLINEAQSADDVVRRGAEAQLLELSDRDASLVFLSFMKVASDSQELLSSRQFALISLRKLITMYWSPGFESYRACSNLKEEAKETVREYLLKLCLNDQEISKVISAAAYCVVQISAVDFPDQWPKLLTVLYDGILNKHSLSAMSLLSEIYDDVMSEEMFFEEGIGLETIRIVFQIVRDPNTNLEAKLAGFNLFHACLQQILTVDLNSAPKRKEMAVECAKEALTVWGEHLQSHSITEHSLQLQIKGRIYEDLSLMKNELSRKLIPDALYVPFKELVLIDLETAGKIYLSISQGFVEGYRLDDLNECAIHIIEFLTATCHFTMDSADVERIITALGDLCCLDNDTVNLWLEDFNSYISMESGLTASYSIRDQASELLTSMDGQNYSLVCQHILYKVSHLNEWKQEWKFQESFLFLVQAAALNESLPSGNFINEIREVLSFLGSMLCSEDVVSFVSSRIILLLPKILEKYMDLLDDVRILTSHLLTKSAELALATNDDIIKASVLIAFTYCSNFAELSSVLGQEVCEITQKRVLGLIARISEDAEDDTDGVLMEVLNNVIDCNTPGVPNNEIVQTEFSLVLKISAKDPANIQIVVESQECLEKLLENLDIDHYKNYVETWLPSFMKSIEGSAQTKYAYSPLLSLVLQFLTTFLKKKPTDYQLPTIMCNLTFEPLRQILLNSEDDETIQLATEAFSYFLYNTDPTVVAPHLEAIVAILDRLLSFDVSDAAAMYVGSLIVTVFTRFSTEIENMMPIILRAAANRLIQAKHLSTSQNLLSVFCFLTSVDPRQTVDFLFGLHLDNTEHNALYSIVSIWLESFESIRGERRTKENVIALIKLYLLHDKRLMEMQVNDEIIPYEGEQIITRSMAKKMPDRYSKVSVYTKIIKLFVAELNFQDKQPDPERFITSDMAKEGNNGNSNNDTDSDGEWEDVDDVLNYEKLQEYVDESDQDGEGSDSDDFFASAIDEYSNASVRDILVSFFKEIAANNTGGFRDIYNSLTEVEKKILSENLV